MTNDYNILFKDNVSFYLKWDEKYVQLIERNNFENYLKLLV